MGEDARLGEYAAPGVMGRALTREDRRQCSKTLRAGAPPAQALSASKYLTVQNSKRGIHPGLKKNTPHYSSPQEVYIEKRAEAGAWTDAAMHPPHQTPAPAPRGALWLQRCTCCVDSTSASPTKTQEMPLF